MYGFGGVGLSEVQISISELSVVGGGGGGGWWVVDGTNALHGRTFTGSDKNFHNDEREDLELDDNSAQQTPQTLHQTFSQLRKIGS